MKRDGRHEHPMRQLLHQGSASPRRNPTKGLFDDIDWGPQTAPRQIEEDWRTNPPLRGCKRGDVIWLGREAFEVKSVQGDYSAMTQKPGAKRKYFNVYQDGPFVHTRVDTGDADSTALQPKILTVPYTSVRVEKGAAKFDKNT